MILQKKIKADFTKENKNLFKKVTFYKNLMLMIVKYLGFTDCICLNEGEHFKEVTLN